MSIIFGIFLIVVVAYLFFRFGKSEQDFDNFKRNEARDEKFEKNLKEYKEYCNTLYFLLGDDAKKVISDSNIRRSLIKDLCIYSKLCDKLSLEDVINLEVNFGLPPFEVEIMELEIICFHINVSMFVEVEDVKKYLQKKRTGT